MTQAQILMAVRDGARHLPAQLDSLAAQSHAGWSLLAGDDGSTDGSAALLADFAAAHPGRGIALTRGPGRGAGANFLTLLGRAAPDRFTFFCDQDDVWMPHKLSRAIARMAPAPGEVVAYAARTVLTDAALRPRRLSAWPGRGAWFGNALVQNILAGNTLALSPAATGLLRQTVPAALAASVPFHDWWAYIVVAGAGGRIVLDPEPVLYYRQHDGNLLGAARGLRAGLARLGQVARGRYAGWIDCNLAALEAGRPLLTPAALACLDGFAAARSGPARLRPGRLAALGIARQSAAGDRALAVLARTGRL